MNNLTEITGYNPNPIKWKLLILMYNFIEKTYIKLPVLMFLVCILLRIFLKKFVSIKILIIIMLITIFISVISYLVNFKKSSRLNWFSGKQRLFFNDDEFYYFNSNILKITYGSKFANFISFAKIKKIKKLKKRNLYWELNCIYFGFIGKNELLLHADETAENILALISQAENLTETEGKILIRRQYDENTEMEIEKIFRRLSR